MSLGLPQHLGQQHNHHVLLLLVVVVFLSPTPGATQTPGDCGIPTVQGGSVPQLPKTTAGAIAMVTCSTGYAMNPSLPASITCQDNGTWSTSPCVQYPELDSYSFCPRTHTVLRDAFRWGKVNYTTALKGCDLHNGKILSVESFQANCTDVMDMKLKTVSWINSSYTDKNGSQVHWSTANFGFFAHKPLHVICEFPVGDHIATITEDCDVVCDRGYAYHHSTPGCKGITQVLSCDLLNCSVPAIQFGMSNAS
eukprot:scpid95830/ scgid5070/ 